MLSLSLLIALPVNAEAPEGAPDPGIALPNLDDGNLGPAGDVANTGPALKRDLRKVLPKLSQMPGGTKLVKLRSGDGEFCPGVRLEAPAPHEYAARFFEFPDGSFLYVEAVAWSKVGRAKRATKAWFRTLVDDCGRYTEDGWRWRNVRMSVPVSKLGNYRRAVRTTARATDGSNFKGAISGQANYRYGKYAILAAVGDVAQSWSDTPRLDHDLLEDAIRYMDPRIRALRRSRK